MEHADTSLLFKCRFSITIRFGGSLIADGEMDKTSSRCLQPTPYSTRLVYKSKDCATDLPSAVSQSLGCLLENRIGLSFLTLVVARWGTLGNSKERHQGMPQSHRFEGHYQALRRSRVVVR
jgi:hypothetical protein